MRVTGSEIACVSCKMWSIVAREVNFGMAVAFMFSSEQCIIETVVSTDISHSDICLNTTDMLRFEAPC